MDPLQIAVDCISVVGLTTALLDVAGQYIESRFRSDQGEDEEVSEDDTAYWQQLRQDLLDEEFNVD